MKQTQLNVPNVHQRGNTSAVVTKVLNSHVWFELDDTISDQPQPHNFSKSYHHIKSRIKRLRPSHKLNQRLNIMRNNERVFYRVSVSFPSSTTSTAWNTYPTEQPHKYTKTTRTHHTTSDHNPYC